MRTMLGILQNTPWWVFALFATLTVLGIQGLRPRTLPIWRVLITPLLFCGWGVESLIVQSLSAPILLADWVITCAGAAALTFVLTHLNNVRINPGDRSVSLAGSPFFLIRNLLIFFAKYWLGVASTLAPALRPELAFLDVAVSGASAGYFLVWMIRFASLYRRSVSPDLAAEARS
jgi:lysylphosphatidylglycerol synthetase-like protein (DUF2156 family)